MQLFQDCSNDVLVSKTGPVVNAICEFYPIYFYIKVGHVQGIYTLGL